MPRQPTDAELDAIEELQDPRGFWEPPDPPIMRHFDINDGAIRAEPEPPPLRSAQVCPACGGPIPSTPDSRGRGFFRAVR
jgi:hypothetical protein